MRKTFLLAFLFIITQNCVAQQRELDSTLRLLQLHYAEDTIKINLLNDIAYYYHNIDPSKGLAFTDSAIRLSQKLNNQAKLSNSYVSKGINYRGMGKDTLALEMFNLALQIDNQLNNKRATARVCNNIALVWFDLSDFVKAIEYHLKSIEIFESFNDTTNLANVYTNIGVDYQYLSDYNKALDYYFKALKIIETSGDKEGLGNTYCNIGIVYKNFASFSKALEYQQKALNTFMQIEDKRGETNSLGNIGVIYSDMNKEDTALQYYQKALAISQEMGNKRQMGSNYENIAISYQSLHDYTKALQNQQKALNIFTQLNDKDYLCSGLTQMSDLCRTAPAEDLAKAGINPANKLSLALTYSNESLKLAQQIQATDRESEAWESLANVYEAKKNFAKALNAYKHYNNLHDSIINDEKKQDVLQKEMQFNFERKEDSIKAENDKKSLIASAEIKRQSTIKKAIAIGAAILLLGALTSFIFYKKRRDAVARQNDAELKAQIADTQMKVMRLQMNPHFIFNSLNSIGDYIIKNEPGPANEYLSKFARLMRMTLENSEKKAVSLEDDLKVLELYMQLEARRLNGKFDYSITVADDIDKENTMVPPMIFQPFIENSIWHGIAKKEGKGKITVDISSDNQILHCMIDDDGIGRQASVTINNEKEKQSLGMKITKARLDILNAGKFKEASVRLIDKQHGGLKAIVNLPLQLNF